MNSAVPAPPGGEEVLPDFSGLDLGTVRTQVSHPALSSVLGAVEPRSRRPQQAAAYYEDSPPDDEDDEEDLRNRTGGAPSRT